ncbi:hypothetical protein Zmor_001357 [Zophobas morio]|uniref:Uncharacterized protein n=1 Tax=Zophobas morio TaxID=2755281 RepID=A0AA38IZ10_9CUCU|nr:hypothetical protein Zmor_001357 [Zophobas morio]
MADMVVLRKTKHYKERRETNIDDYKTLYLVQSGIAEELGVHQSTVSKVVTFVTTRVTAKVSSWIKFPHTEQDILQALEDWQNVVMGMNISIEKDGPVSMFKRLATPKKCLQVLMPVGQVRCMILEYGKTPQFGKLCKSFRMLAYWGIRDMAWNSKHLKDEEFPEEEDEDDTDENDEDDNQNQHIPDNEMLQRARVKRDEIADIIVRRHLY